MLTIAGRRVYLRTGQKSQSVNICYENQPVVGAQEFIFRINDRAAFLSKTALLAIQFEKLDDFRIFLEEIGATKRPVDRTHRMNIELLRPADDMPSDIEETLDQCVNNFIDNFFANPYKHRCEHSIHIDLFNLISSVASIENKHVNIDNRFRAPLVHKEWPEPKPMGGARRRGSHDIAILRPCKTGIEQFYRGFIEPFAAFELGLNYGLWHFVKDVLTLQHAKLASSYVIHLARAESTEQTPIIEKAQQLIEANHSGTDGWPKIALAIITGSGDRYRKYANKIEIEKLSL